MRSDEHTRRILLERLARLGEVVLDATTRPDRLTQGAIEFASALHQLLEIVQSDFTERWDALIDVLDEGERRQLRSELLIDIKDVVADLTLDLLPILLGARAAQVPTEYELVVEELLSSLSPGWGAIPIIWGSDEYSYAMRRWEYPTTLYEGSADNDPTKPDFIEFQLPSLERDSTLLHGVLVSHELGHALDSFYELSTALVIPEGKDIFGGDQTAEEPQLLHSAYVFTRVAKNWAEELIADIFSALIFGPVALFSFTEFSESTGSPEADSGTHPGSDRRFDVICQVLEELGLNALPIIKDWIDEFRAAYPNALDRPVKMTIPVDEEGGQEAWNWVRGELPALIAACRDKIGANAFSVEAWNQSEAGAKALLAGNVYGEEISNMTVAPIAPGVILNAGWLVKADSLPAFGKLMNLDADDPEEIGDITAALDGLIAKSLEISFHRRRTPWE